MTSSDAVVKGVARKLKYYFDIKRLEDGFDLSGVNSPQLDHPPLKSRATLQYDGLHDRALKHYFSLPEVRCKLTNMGPGDGLHREEKVRRKLKRRMNRYDYKPKTHPAFAYAQTGRDTFDVVYPLKGNKKALKGGWPQLRSVPSQNITRGEAQRLVNIATKLLVATETVDIIQPRPPSPKRGQSAPKPFEAKEKKRPSTAKYTWDIHGRRHMNEKEKPTAYDDSYSPKHSRHNASEDNKGEQRRVVIKKVMRPSTATTTTTSDHPEKSERSARSDRSSRSQKSDQSKKSDRSPKSDRSEITSRSHRSESLDSEAASTTDRSSSDIGTKTSSGVSVRDRPATHKSTVIHVRDTDIREDVKVSHSTQAGDSVSIQTETRMIENYNPLDEEIKQGDWAEYQIYVRTGNRTGASASSNIEVKLTMYGNKGRTKEFVLQDSKRHLVMFQRGKEDLFVLACHHVGKLRQIKIGHDRTSLRDAWYLEGVTVYDMYDKRIYEFNCERWLSAHDGDRKTYRVLEMDRDRAFIEALHGDDDSSTRSMSDSETELTTPRGSARYDDSKSSRSSVRVRGGKDIKYRKKDFERGSDSESSYTSDSSSEGSTDRTPKIRPLSPLKKPDEDEFFDTRGSGPTFLFQDGKGAPPKESDSVRANISVDSTTSEDTSSRVREDFLEGYKVGLKAAEEDSKTRTDEEVLKRKRVLAGPTIHEAAQAGNLARVQELLQHYPEMKESKDESGRTPLHLASTDGHIDVVKWLAIGESSLNLETPTGYTAMHLAAMNGHVNCMMILFALGATISLKTSDKKTPLYLAAMKGHLECVKWLIANRARFDIVDDMDRTPRMVAEDFGHRDVSEFLKACENEMNDPNSGFAQMRSTSKLGPGGLQTIEEDSNSSVSQEDRTWQDDKDNYSDKAGIGSDGGSQRARSARNIDREKETKKKIYEEQHQKMEETGDSFLDSIRHEFDTRPEP
ncbi:uncharacterized protein LOC132554929 [Ylistrum balloti]|uniref:uncharacterized protein LOC132554929 n=1 Tax=Ylistrum balloti TaxID=509963 RepID=UPI002905B846|nr:uncharacterized protein LOC132554929 [Ylistrum balloti]